MPKISANGIQLEYDTFGDASDPPMLLVMGFGLQMIAWDERLCALLAKRGFHVVRFDNRDVGLSSQIDGAFPDLGAAMSGDAAGAPYSLDDMALDTLGLLDALKIPRAHFVGVSMGGMISQLVAIKEPSRVMSLCSIMSSTGDRSVGQPSAEAVAAVMTPATPTREGIQDNAVNLWKTIGSPGYPFDEAHVRERAAMAFDRCYAPIGIARQLAALVTAHDRTDELAKLHVPTLVIHGAVDPLIDRSGGEATARAIPAAELMIFEGMGHDMPEALWPRFVDAIVTNTARPKRA